jgi:hypothetical protein
MAVRRFADRVLRFSAGLALGSVPYVSNMSHSSPSTHRSAESLPLIMPHSKSVHSPRLSIPTSFSVRLAAARAPFQILASIMSSR